MRRLSRNPGALTSRTPQGHVGLFRGYFKKVDGPMWTNLSDILYERMTELSWSLCSQLNSKLLHQQGMMMANSRLKLMHWNNMPTATIHLFNENHPVVLHQSVKINQSINTTVVIKWPLWGLWRHVSANYSHHQANTESKQNKWLDIKCAPNGIPLYIQ
jgi:hypothetical protein